MTPPKVLEYTFRCTEDVRLSDHHYLRCSPEIVARIYDRNDYVQKRIKRVWKLESAGHKIDVFRHKHHTWIVRKTLTTILKMMRSMIKRYCEQIHHYAYAYFKKGDNVAIKSGDAFYIKRLIRLEEIVPLIQNPWMEKIWVLDATSLESAEQHKTIDSLSVRPHPAF